MKKLIKILLLTLTGLVVLVGAGLALIFLVIDPVRYKPTIESVFAQQTGLQLNIAGEIDWAFSPVFGLSINDLRLSNSGARQELASLSRIAIKIEPRALLDGRLEMQEFVADGLHINWIVDASGVSNWQSGDSSAAAEPAAQATTSTSSSTSPSADGTTIAAAVQQITVSNASLSIQDAGRGLNTTFSNLNLSSQNTNLENRPFPFELSFNVTDNIDGQDAEVSLASTATIDFAAGNARFDNLQLKLNPLQLSGSLAAQDFRNNLSWSGSLASNTFPLTDFLDMYLRPAADDTLAVPGNYSADSDQFSMRVEFNGNSQQINVPVLALTLDDMQVTADAAYTLGSDRAPANLRYNLAANALDLNRYTRSAADSPAEAAPAAATAATDTALPIDLLNSMNVQGRHNIESLAVGGLTFTGINASLDVLNGVLKLDVQPIGFYEGQITSTLNFDTRQSPPSLTNISSLRNINLALLAQNLPMADFAAGRLNLEALHTLRGSTVNQLLESVDGRSSFSVADSAIDVAMLKQVLSSISVLSPAGTGDMVQQWPDVVRFSTLEGHLILAQGLAENQQLNVTLDNVEISANGGIDLNADSFNYDVLLTVFGPPAVQTVPVSELYQGVQWPVLCSATFASEVSQYCGPDFGKVRDLFVQISRNQVQRRVQDAVSDQVPADLQDAARGLLDRLLR
ncbi:MAG: AsmA family protein [Gammaproteobacteria bacterium]|nr:AsmA family protein [Gammaproteobacteria bacterium]